MRFRDFIQRPAPRPDDPAETGDGEHGELFRHAADLLAAGDEAIGRALSIDSEQYLAANHQEGGE